MKQSTKAYLKAVRRTLRTERTLCKAVLTGNLASFRKNESFRTANVQAVRRLAVR